MQPLKVHFGVDLGGRDSQRRMLDLIKEAQVDVVSTVVQHEGVLLNSILD